MSFPGDIKIMVDVEFIEEKQDGLDRKMAFAYTITIANLGDESVKLTDRYWLITHGNGRTEEVRGPGVVGEQPVIRPGEAFEYTSGSMIESDVGTMEGKYYFIHNDGRQFHADIPQFILSPPRTIH
ncbi:MAG: Co2+/Mg2+ efflux protein ApaG [bacterium]